MKNLIFFLSILLFTISCGDDSSDCTSDMITGTYEGVATCEANNISSTATDTYVVTLDGDQLAMTSSDGTVTSFNINGCDLDAPETTIDFFGSMVTASGKGKYEEGMLEIEVAVSIDGEETVCTFVGMKQ